jgi:PAS domain S-box-containing protein
MQSEQSSTSRLPLQKKNGSTIPVDMNIFQGSWKNRQAIFGVARDIAGRQQTENALRESQQMLQLIMNTIPMSVFWKDQDSVYLGCNQTFIQTCGLNDEREVIGKTPFDLFDSDNASSLITRDQQVITTNQPLFNALHSHTRPDGTAGWRESSKIPLQDGEGNAVGVLGVWRDVTEQYRAEERLKRTLDDMERFNQLMRGRERRTLELKAEINSLLVELGRQVKYTTAAEES